MPKKVYTKEFKDNAVRLVLDQDMTGIKVSQDLGVSYSALTRWIREYREDGKSAFPGKGKQTPEDAEKRELEKRLRRAETERDILKKAIAYFAQVP
jgi:transposase